MIPGHGHGSIFIFCDDLPGTLKDQIPPVSKTSLQDPGSAGIHLVLRPPFPHPGCPRMWIGRHKFPIEHGIQT